MARLIPQKQIEEVNIFRDSISVGNSVFISGSLLVSQSIDIGNDLTTPQRITGSVQITGSINIDGDLTFARAESRLDATASFSDVSVDTQRFGGIPVAEFGGSDATVYVSATRGDDSNDGRSPQFPVRTIKRAAQIVTPGDDGRYGLPTGSNFTGFRIDVQAGTYLEDNPVELPRNTTVWGAGLRVTKVVAKNENEDLFWVNSGNYLAEMTFAGLRVFPSVDDSQKGFAISFAPNAFITTSPYVQNCSMISNQENSFLEAYEDIPAGGGGLNVDGNRIHPDSPLASMVLDAYTQVAPNGVGCQVVGRGFIQLVSFFTNFSAYSVKVIDGGQAVLLNSNTSFGDFGMYASGSRFITGSGGNTEAFLNVQDNYSIIVDTIERGLGEIPDLVTNTEDGIKVTNELQKFNTGAQASDKDAKTVVSDYRLISNLIERGVENKIPILAVSSDRGYNSGSVWNVSGDNQITSSTTASEDDLSTINTNYDIVLDIIERGNAATSSYIYVDNVSSSIKISDVEQYKSSPVSDITEDTIGERFDTIISIIENGLDFIPEIKLNTSQSFKVTDTTQYITDLSSSLNVREAVSSSLSIVYNILDNGTGSAPAIIQSSSNENPTIDYQNAYALLIENIPFIQEETIAYLSSSWSEFEYNQTTCKRDVGYIVSGAAHDLLYGGNEESVRNGNFYYLYPSDATTTQKDPTLTAIKYVAGMVDNILSDTTFVETTAEADNAYSLLFENKRFIQSESIAYVSSSWSTFEYNEAKCVRDLGYIIDAVATDIKYGGNERSVIAGNFYYKYPSQATVNNSTVGGQLNQTIDGIKYAKRIAQKLAKNETFVTQSASTLTIADTLLQNRSLIQDETITYINTTYPNFSYNEAKCRRDTGYILDGVITDLRYGGVERSQLSGLYYYLYPSIANTTQLEETLEGIRYSKGFALEVAQSNLIEIPTAKRNIEKRIKVGDVQYITSSISGTEFESKYISGSIGIVEDIIRFGNDSVLASIAENTGSFNWSISSPINVSSVLPITSSVTESVNIQNVSDGFDIVTSIIAGGESVIPQPTSSWEGTIKVTDTPQYISSSLSSTSTEATLVSQSIAIVANIVQNGVDSLPPLTASIDGLIKVTNQLQNTDYSGSLTEATKVSSSFATITNIVENGVGVIPTIVSNTNENIKFFNDSVQYISSSFSGSLEDVSFISSSISYVTSIIANGTGSYTASEYPSQPLSSSNAIAAYQILRNNIDFIKDETIAYLSSSWSTASYDESKCRRDVGLIISGAAEDLIWGTVSSSIVNGKFYYEYPSQAQGAQLNQTLDGVFFASEVAQKLIQNIEFVTASVERRGAWNAITENEDFIKEEMIQYLSSSWSTFDYNETTCRRDAGYILDAVKTDIYYGGNERSAIAGNFYYLYPSAAILSGSASPTPTTQLVPTLDGLRYAGRITEAVVTGSSFSFPSQAKLDAKNVLLNNKQFVQDETIAYLSSSWSEFSYNQTTCKRDIGFIIDAAVTDVVYGGNERSRIASNFYYRYPSAAIVGGVPSTTQQKDPTVDGIKYVGGISEKIVLGETFTSADSTKITIKNSIIDNKSNVQQQTIDYINDTYPNLNYNNDKCFRDVGFIIDAVVTDLVYGGNGRSVQAGAFYYRFPSQATFSQLSETVDGINFARDLIKLDLRGANSVENSFDTVIKIIESGSSIVTEETIGTGSAPVPESQIGDPISTIGIPKDSYGDGLVKTVITTSIPTFELTENTDSGIKFGSDTQITGSITSSVSESLKVSSSFSDIIDIIKYGTSGSLSLSGSFDTSTYYEVVTPETGDYYIINRAQLDEFDGVRAGGYFNTEENTGSFSDGIKDPTLTLKRGEMYTFSVNALKYDLNPFYIKTARKPNKEALYNEGVTNNGVNFGTLTFIVPLEAPDRLYYVNGNNVSASGIINVVDNLPISDTQRYIEVPSKGFVEITTNNVDNIKISNISQYSSSFSASVDESHEISSSFATTIEILKNGVDDLPTIVENTSGSIKVTNTSQITSSITPSEYELNNVSSSYAIVIDVLQNGTSSLPTEISNTSASIKVTDVPQYISSSVSGTLENVNFISSSVSIVYNIVQLGSSGSYTASLYDTGSGVSTDESTIAAYQIIRNNIPFIQSESLAYLSSSWSTASYDEVKCGRDIGLIISGAAEDLIWGTVSSSVVNGRFYLEYPSQAETSQLNQTLDGIEYASKLTQKLIQNIQFVTASNEASASHQLLLDNKVLIQNETIEYISSSWSDFVYSDILCRRDIGHIVDAAATDILYGGNERSVQAASFYYSNPSAATGSQLNQTVDAINYARRISNKILQNQVLELPELQTLGVAELISENKSLIQEETIQFLSSSWSTFEYNEAKCRRDTGYIIDAVVTDFVYGGNERAVNAGEFYYLYPSDATGSQLTQTVDGITYAQRLTNKLINNITLVTSSLERRATKDLLMDNKGLIQNEVIHFISSSWSTFEYNESKCKRDVGYILDAIATDIVYGGNERSVVAGEFYYRYPSEATTTQLDQTITGVKHAAGLSEKIIQNTLLVNPDSNTLEAYNRIRNNKLFIQSEVIEFVDNLYPYFTYNRVKCKRDVGFILDAVATDLLWGGNERSIIAGDYYYRYPSQATTFQLRETIEGIRYAKALTKDVILNKEFERPRIILNSENHIKVDGVPQYSGSMAISGSNLTEISSSFEIINNVILGGLNNLPTEHKGIESLTKVTNAIQTTNSATQSVSDISSSFAIVIDVIQNGVGNIPTIVSNTNNNIKVGNIEQYISSSASGSLENVNFISSSIDIVTDIITNGVGGYVPTNYTTSSTDESTIAAYQILRNNIDFIQEETIAYLSSSWSGFVYDESKCRRDVGLIVSGAAEDLIWNTDSSSIVNGKFYLEYPSQATSSQLDQTLDGIFYASNLAQKLIQNVTFSSADSTIVDSYNSIVNEKATIQSKVIAYLSSSFPTHQYNESKCSRDVGYIIDGVATDLLYGGNERSVKSGNYYYKYPSQATGYQLEETVAGIEYAQRLTEVASQNKGTQIGIVSASIDMINDIIRLGSDDIPFTIAKHFQTSELDTPQQLTTGSYTQIAGPTLDSEYNNGSIISLTGDGSDFFKKEVTVNGVRIVVAGDVGGQTAVPDAFTEKVARMFELFTDPSGSGINETFQRNLIKTLSGDSGTYHAGLPTIQRVARGAGSDYTPNFLDDAGILYWNLTNLFDTHVQNDMVWYLNSTGDISGSGDIDAQEVIEHIFHTLHMHGLPADDIKLYSYLASDWQTGDLYLAMEEAYDAGLWDSSGYGGNSWKTDSDAFEVAAKEYLYLLNFSMFEYTDLWENGSLSPEWDDSMRTQAGILANNPLGYAFHNTYISPTISKPSLATIRSIFQDGDLGDPTIAGESGYVVTPTGTYTTDTELAIVSSSFSLINDIIENTTSSIADFVDNTYNKRKFTNTTQYSSSVSASTAELSIVDNRFGIVVDIVENGLSQKPTIVRNNTDVDNLIKVTDTPQYISASSADKLQSKIVSSSIAIVTDIIENGSGSAPTIIEYTTPSDSPKAKLAYQLIKNNLPFIVSESIAYISSSWSDFSYNEASCSRDVALIVSGAAEDLIWNSNSASVVNGKFYLEYPSAATGSQLQQTLDGINYASTLTQHIVRNRTFVTASSSVSASYNLLVENKEFIQNETIAYLSSSWSDFYYSESKCKRDVGYIIDAVATDLKYGGNERSVIAGDYYYRYPSAAIVGGVPNVDQQKDPTVTGINYAKSLANELLSGSQFVTASNEVEFVYDSIRENREFIQAETVAFVNAKYPNLEYNEASCSRDAGFIVDAVATDLRWGGNQRSIVAGQYYYKFPSQATTAQLGETTDAVIYASKLVTELIDKNTLPIPSASLNTNNNIKVTSTPQYISASSAGEVELTKISSSFASVSGIVEDGVSVIPTLVENLNENIKVTNVTQYISSSASGSLENISFISESVEIVTDIISNGTGSLPLFGTYTTPSTDESTIAAYQILRSNISFIQSESIAYLSSSWSTASYDEAKCARDIKLIISGAAEDLIWNANSASIVNGKFYYEYPSQAQGAQLNQTLDGINYASRLAQKLIQNIEFVTASSERVVTSELLRLNTPFIQTETIAYLSSSWSTFDYDEVTCKRDVGYIIDAVRTDIVYGGNERTNKAGNFYYLYPSQATGSQLDQTLDGIRYAGRLAEKVASNIQLVSPSSASQQSYDLLRDNKGFIQSESIAYLSSSWSEFDYNQETCKRDIGYILDAISTDILYGGTERSVIAGNYYYKYPSSATNAQLDPTVTGIEYAGDMMEKVIVNQIFQSPSAERIAGNESLLNNRTFIQSESLAYLTASWSTFEYNKDKCARDVGYIVDAVATDFLYGGNERSRTAGEYYYLYPSEATSVQANQTTDGVKYAGRISEALVQNIQFVTASTEVSASFDLLRKNKPFIAEETIQYVSSSWSGVYYDEAKCRRDTGFIVDAAATDLLYGGNERSVIAGNYYFKYPSSATERGVPSVVSQLDPTTTGIKYASGLAQNVIQNIEWNEPSASVLVAADLLVNNKTFIQKETIAFLSSSWSEFAYNDVSCSRDLGYIIDAVRTDLVYGGNERSIQAATFYYYIPSVAITEQKPQTIDGIDFAKGMAEKVIKQDQLTFASLNRRNGYNELRAAKKYLQSSAISYTEAAFPGFEYNEEKCYRDTGFILDAISTDLLYGGNERSIEAAKSYYNGVYGDASVVINEQKKETAETNRYLRTLFQKVARNAPLELFGSLIITTGHDFSYAGSGVTYKALPPNQGGNGVPDPDKEIVELGGGRVFFTAGNELGDFKIGTGLVINQATGTLQGRTFSRSLFSLVTPFSLALEG